MTRKETADWLPKWEYPGEEDYHSEVLNWADLSLVKTAYHMTGKDTADWLPKWEYPGEEDYHSEVLHWAEWISPNGERGSQDLEYSNK